MVEELLVLVVLVLLSSVTWYKTTLRTGTPNPCSDPVGVYNIRRHTKPMRYSNLDRLLFVGSFVWVAHWATKVSEVTFNALF
jgi:hypothetical protein